MELIVFAAKGSIALVPRALVQIRFLPRGDKAPIGLLLVPLAVLRVEPGDVATGRNVQRLIQAAKEVKLSSRVGFGVVKIPGNKIRDGNAVDRIGEDFARVADFDQVLDLMPIGRGIDVRITDEFVAQRVDEHFKKLGAGGDATVVAALNFGEGHAVLVEMHAQTGAGLIENGHWPGASRDRFSRIKRLDLSVDSPDGSEITVKLLDRSTFALGPAAPSRDDESLTEWMRMPCSPRAGLESYAGTLNERRIVCLKSGSIRTVPVNHSDGPLTEGCAPIRLISIF